MLCSYGARRMKNWYQTPKLFRNDMSEYGTHKIIYSPTPRLGKKLMERDVNYGYCYELEHAYKIRDYLSGKHGIRTLSGNYKVVRKDYQLKEV